MDPLRPEDPQSLGSYRLLGRLGAGGMGRVYLARSPGGRTVAVKVVRPDLAQNEEFRRRFRHEVDVARAVSGRYTAPVVDADTDAELPWLATQYVTGPSLTDVVEQHGALPEKTVRALGAGLSAALVDLHAGGLIHRDLKPSNVLMAADGPRVIDFGIARAVDGDRMTQTGVAVGSPGYMPPEQAMGREVGTPGDVFALGAVIAFAATGRSTFGDGALAATLYKVVHEDPDLTGLPDSLDHLVRSCLAKTAAGRPTPEAILQELEPDGPQDAFRDWLPGAVASTIATLASRILDLETPPPGSLLQSRQPPVPGRQESQPQGSGPPASHTQASDAAEGQRPGPDSPGGPDSLRTMALGRQPREPRQEGEATDPSAPVPSRRRFLGIAAAGVGVAAVGGGAVAFVSSGKGGGANAPEPARGSFSTPPPGVAPQPLWRRTMSEGEVREERPLVLAGRVYVAGDPVRAYNIRTKKLEWQQGLTNADGGKGFVARDGVVYFGSGEYDGALVGIRARTDKEVWRARLPGKLEAEAPLATDGKLLFAVADVESDDTRDRTNAICAIDLKTRKKAWHEQRDEGTRTFDDLYARAVPGYLVYGDGNRNVTVRETSEGRQLWTKPLGAEYDPPKPLIINNAVVVQGSTLRAYDLESGDRKWELGPNGRRGFKRPALFDGTLYVFDSDSGFWAVDPKSGEKLWMTDEVKSVSAPEEMVKIGNTIYAASGMDDGIFAFDAKNGKHRWTFTAAPGDSIGGWHVAAAGERLVASRGKDLYVLPAV